MGRTRRTTFRGHRVLAFGLACTPADDQPASSSTDATTTASVDPVSYAACDDPVNGCDAADCRRRDDASGAWSICVPPCMQDADCPIGAGGNVQVVCDPQGRCVLECVPQIMSCPSGTTCVDGDPAQCMWPVP